MLNIVSMCRTTLLGFTLSLLASGCGGTSTEELAKSVRAEIAEKIKSDPDMSGIEIGDLTLVHRSGNEYRGILEVTENGAEQQYSVSVTYDGSSLMWELEQ